MSIEKLTSIIVPRQADAVPFINLLRLRKDLSVHPFPVYTGPGGIFLCVSGEGAVNAAGAVGFWAGCRCGLGRRLPRAYADEQAERVRSSELFGGSLWETRQEDWLLHIGSCENLRGLADGGLLNRDELLYPHVIVDAAAGRALYPEMLYRHPFWEGTLVSGCGYSCGLKREKPESPGDKTPSDLRYGSYCGADAWDREAASVFQAASRYLPLHRILVVKKVAGDSNGQGAFTQTQAETVMAWLRGIRAATSAAQPQAIRFSDAERAALGNTVARLRLTKEMERGLFAKALSYKIKGGNLPEALAHAERQGNAKTPTTQAALGCKTPTKDEGKRAFAEVMDFLSGG